VRFFFVENWRANPDWFKSIAMMDVTEQQFLHAVFCLSRAGKEISLKTIAKAGALGTTDTVVAMLSLGCRGLLDTDRMRLTMEGLAVAAGLVETQQLERRERIRARIRARARLALTPTPVGESIAESIGRSTGFDAFS
jgi:hypothetical protein